MFIRFFFYLSSGPVRVRIENYEFGTARRRKPVSWDPLEKRNFFNNFISTQKRTHNGEKLNYISEEVVWSRENIFRKKIISNFISIWTLTYLNIPFPLYGVRLVFYTFNGTRCKQKRQIYKTTRGTTYSWVYYTLSTVTYTCAYHIYIGYSLISWPRHPFNRLLHAVIVP